MQARTHLKNNNKYYLVWPLVLGNQKEGLLHPLSRKKENMESNNYWTASMASNNISPPLSYPVEKFKNITSSTQFDQRGSYTKLLRRS